MNERHKMKKLIIIFYILFVLFPMIADSIILIHEKTLRMSTQWMLIIMVLVYSLIAWFEIYNDQERKN